MKVFAVVCSVCKCTVYSRAHYDFIKCPCGDVWVDGGQKGHCVRYGSGWSNERPQTKSLDLDVDLSALYKDWNHNKNEYGIIYPDGYEIGLRLLYKWANEDETAATR